MSNRINVTVYRNNVMTKDGTREVFKVRAWDAVTQSDGVVTFKLKLSAAMSLPKGFADQFQWERLINEETGEIKALKCKMAVYGQIATDKTGGLWLNPFNAVRNDDGKWKIVDREDPNGQPMAFYLTPWNKEEQVKNSEMVAAEDTPL